MSETHKVALLAYAGFDLLDVSGPASVFAEANVVLERTAYDVVVLSPSGGEVAGAGGVGMSSHAVGSPRSRGVHTLLVSGAQPPGLMRVLKSEDTRRWVRSCTAGTRRYGSVCSGAFVLAAWGLLDGKNVVHRTLPGNAARILRKK